MTSKQEDKIKDLLVKYNDILLISMRLAVAEDFANLILLNREDTDFELKDLLEKKTEFSNQVMKEFLRLNSSSVTSKLSSMTEPDLSIQKQKRLNFK
jgi:hypothetical protein